MIRYLFLPCIAYFFVWICTRTHLFFSPIVFSRFLFGGRYWGILPSILVGLTVRYAGWLAMHTFNRSQQTKKSLVFEMKQDKRLICLYLFLILILAGLIAVATWSFTHDDEPNYEQNDLEGLAADASDDLIAGFLGSTNLTNIEL